MVRLAASPSLKENGLVPTKPKKSETRDLRSCSWANVTTVKCLKRHCISKHQLAKTAHPKVFKEPPSFHTTYLQQFAYQNSTVESQWPVVVKNHIPWLLWRVLSQSKGHRTVTQRLKGRFTDAFGSSLRELGPIKQACFWQILLITWLFETEKYVNLRSNSFERLQ